MFGESGPLQGQLQQQILTLKQQQQLQQQMLLQRFQVQQQQLAEEHEKQLQDYHKVTIATRAETLLFQWKRKGLFWNGTGFTVVCSI